MSGTKEPMGGGCTADSSPTLPRMRPLTCVSWLQYVDLRTQYSELTTLTSQYIKFISETLRRLEEEEVGERRVGVAQGLACI